MPNGGSDNCGMCRCFEKAVLLPGDPLKSPSRRTSSPPRPGRCTLRRIEITTLPFWTYCDNYDGRNLSSLGGPVGPVLVSSFTNPPERVVGYLTRLDEIVRYSLTAFTEKALHEPLTGRRERQAVSQYVLGYLLPSGTHNRVLRDPTQVGIEVPVPQVPGPDRKAPVTKDVVFWPKPGMTCWDDEGLPTVPPAAVMEWKFGPGADDAHDVQWLTEYSIVYPRFVGYSVVARPGDRGGRTLACTRVARGIPVVEWLVLPGD